MRLPEALLSRLALTILLTCLACGASESRSTPTGPGRVFIEPSQPVPVETAGSWKLFFEARDEIRAGAAIALRIWPEWGWTAPQLADPTAPGFVHFDVGSATARLEARPLSSEGTLFDGIQLRLVEGRLEPGDRVEIEYRDATTGSFAGANQGFAVAVDATGDGRWQTLEPAATFPLLAGPATHLWVVAPSTLPADAVAEARVSVLDRWGNLIRSRGVPASVPVVHATDRQTGLSGISSRIWPEEDAAALHVYWGDLHGHAGFSDGVGSPEDYFRYARDAAGLDFAALTEHDAIGPVALDAARFARLVQIAEEFNAPQHFVTLFGYEYTNWVTGHLTVLSPSPSLPLLSVADPHTDQVEELWAQLARLPDLPVLTIPHHSGGSTMATDWSHFDPRFVRTVELFSVHGSSECEHCPGRVQRPKPGSFVLDALLRGYRLAFIGSGDTHSGHPGRNPRLRPHRTGLVGVWARALTRDAIWQAIERGRTFATTGSRTVPRLERDGDRLALEVRAAGELAKLEIVKNGRVVWHSAPATIEARDSWRDPEPPASGDFYYLRVTEANGHMAWTSPIYSP